MAGNRRRHLRRRKSWEYGDGAILLRVGSRRSLRHFHEISVTGRRDAPRFARLIEDQVRAFPRDPLIISVNGYQPWLQEILSSCIDDYWSDISDLDREVQFASTMQFPERASKRGRNVPWSFITDHMNVPQVYYWSVGMEPPSWDDSGLPNIDHYRFRVGGWECGRGACRFDREVAVAIIFTKPLPVSEHVVTELLFGYLYQDGDFKLLREDDEGICWLFSRLHWLLTDWQNILSEIAIRLDEAEANSHGRHLPVKKRTRSMHYEVNRLYEMKDYLRFHNRSFKKLQKLKDAVPKQGQSDPLWADMDDSIEGLDQYDSAIDSLKERFTNLIDLEFNIQNVVQSDQGAFLTIVATLFLPLSYLAGIFGITTITWKPIWYLYAAIPIFIASIAFTLLFQRTVRWVQKRLYPYEELEVPLQPRNFTMLGQELPDSVNAANGHQRAKTARHLAQMTPGRNNSRARSRSRMKSEKYDDDQ